VQGPASSGKKWRIRWHVSAKMARQ
jgi:hypothetical protein